MTIIDVHAHYLPTALGEVFSRLGPVQYPLRHPTDQTARLADLDAAGVERQIISLGAVQPYWPDAGASTEAARYANDLYADVVRQHGRRLGAFGAVPLPHAEASVAEAIRCLDELGFEGIGLGCSADGVPLDDPRFDGFWTALDERSAVAHIHPGTANSCLVGVAEHPMLLGPNFGSTAEEGVAATRLALSGHVSRFSNVKFVFAGMGGALPIQYDKLTHSLHGMVLHGDASVDVEAVLAELNGLWFDASTIDPVTTLAMELSFGLERVVFGSDAPWGSAAATRSKLHANVAPEVAEAILARGITLWKEP